MSLATLIVIKLVGTFALILGLLLRELVRVRRALARDRAATVVSRISRTTDLPDHSRR